MDSCKLVLSYCRVNNAINTVRYVTTGELTDYVGKHYKDIVVVSPEAGTSNRNSRSQNPGKALLREIMLAVRARKE